MSTSPKALVASFTMLSVLAPGCSDDHARDDVGGLRGTNLTQCNLWLGGKANLARNPGSDPAPFVIGPLLRHIETMGDRQTREIIGYRERHRDLAIRLLAELPAVLMSDAGRSMHGLARGAGSPGEPFRTPWIGSRDRSTPLVLRDGGLSIDEPVWDVTVFTKNRERFLEGEIADRFFEAVLEQARAAGLLSGEHFTVDGTLIEAVLCGPSCAHDLRFAMMEETSVTSRGLHGRITNAETARTTAPLADL